jgi:hypothetical protein
MLLLGSVTASASSTDLACTFLLGKPVTVTVRLTTFLFTRVTGTMIRRPQLWNVA